MRRVLGLGGALCLLSCGALTVLLHFTPLDYDSAWGNNARGARHFSAALGIAAAPLPLPVFRGLLTVGLLLAWAGYGTALFAGRLGQAPAARRVALIALPFTVGLAVLLPPALSSDAYAYVGYGRLWALHGLDPYVATQGMLKRLGDPTGAFLSWDIPSPYGPAWTLICVGAVALLRDSSLFVQVLAMKLCAAAALIALAYVVRALARVWDPGRADLAYLAVALNPALLIEGPGNGHNDVLMMLPLAAALLLLARRRPATLAALLVGTAAAVKWVPLLAAPWLALVPDGSTRARRLLRPALALVPLLVAGAFFGPPLPTAGAVAHLGSHARGAAAGALLVAAALVYLGATAWVAHRGAVAAAATAWAMTVLACVFVGPTVFAPWYVAWPLGLSLARWDRLGTALSVFACSLAAGLMLLYARVV